MKSATILAKSDQLFPELAKHLESLRYPHTGIGFNSIRLLPDAEYPFTLYDRTEGSLFFEKYEIPPDVLAQGYKFAYMAECRNEVLFCEIVGSVPPTIDILVCDSNGQLYSPQELRPDTISL